MELGEASESVRKLVEGFSIHWGIWNFLILNLKPSLGSSCMLVYRIYISASSLKGMGEGCAVSQWALTEVVALINDQRRGIWGLLMMYLGSVSPEGRMGDVSVKSTLVGRVLAPVQVARGLDGVCSLFFCFGFARFLEACLEIYGRWLGRELVWVLNCDVISFKF